MHTRIARALRFGFGSRLLPEMLLDVAPERLDLPLVVPDRFGTTTFRVATGSNAASRGPLTPGYTNMIPPGSAEKPTAVRKLVSNLFRGAVPSDPEGITFE